MTFKHEWKTLAWLLGGFLLAFYLPIGHPRFDNAVYESLELLRWYAREHVLLCLVPAFFIAGVISVFVSQASVIRYFGANAVKWKAYLIASVSGSVLAVCSCTILPLFSSIHKRGAGLGPGIAFLYSGPAINILAIILTARILGWELGVARVIGAVVFSIVIGVIMAVLYRREEQEKAAAQMNIVPPPETRPLWQTSLHFFALVGVLVFANWGSPGEDGGFFALVHAWKWWITAGFGVVVAWSLYRMLKVHLAWIVGGAVLIIAVHLIVPGQPLYPFVVGTVLLTLATAFTAGEPREWLESS